jgi:hypothetical protein
LNPERLSAVRARRDVVADRGIPRGLHAATTQIAEMLPNVPTLHRSLSFRYRR